MSGGGVLTHAGADACEYPAGRQTSEETHAYRKRWCIGRELQQSHARIDALLAASPPPPLPLCFSRHSTLQVTAYTIRNVSLSRTRARSFSLCDTRGP